MAGALVRDATEMRILRQALGMGLDGVRLYTPFAHQYLQMAENGIQPHILCGNISAEEAYSIYRRAFKDAAGVSDTFPLTENPVKLNLARFCKVHYWEYLSEVYAMDLALSRILEQLDGEILWYVQAFNDRPTSASTLTSANFIVGKMLDVLRRERPLAVRRIAHHGVWSLSFQKEIRLCLGALRRTGKDWMGRAKGWPKMVKSVLSTEARVIAFGNGYDALLVIPEALELAAKSGRTPLLMADAVDKETNRTGLVWREEYGQIERFSIAEHLSTLAVPPLSRKEKCQADYAFEELMRRLNQIDEVGRYRLTSTMRNLRQEFRYILWRAKVLDHVLAHFAGSTLVVTHFNGTDERIIEQLARHHGVEVHARPHGWMNSFEGFEYLADRYYCDGQMRAELLNKVYGYGSRIEIKPDPNLINAAREWLQKRPSEQQLLSKNRRAALSIKAPLVILLMTTAARRRVLNEFDFTKLSDCWNALLDYLKGRCDVHVIVKSHKNNFDGWVEALASRRGVTNLTILTGRLEDALQLADLVVDFGKPGTATLSALLFERPLLLYKGLYKYVRDLGDLVYEAGHSFVVQNPQGLIGEWECFRRDSSTYCRDLKKRNHSLLRALVQL